MKNGHTIIRGRGLARLPRILAIDPGTRYMGLAVFVGNELIRAEIKRVREAGMTPREARRKGEEILHRWIRRYEPTILAVEAPYFAQTKSSPGLRRVMETITRLAVHHSIPVRTYRPPTIRQRLCPDTRPTRLAVARTIADRFPWLRPYYEREVKKSWWRRHYWLQLFDAIAVGLACLETHPNKKTAQRAA